MPDRQPVVLILIPSFNQAAFLHAPNRTVHTQDCPRLETIAIDGGLIDRSVDMVRLGQGRR
jgi:hypothetical protein